MKKRRTANSGDDGAWLAFGLSAGINVIQAISNNSVRSERDNVARDVAIERELREYYQGIVADTEVRFEEEHAQRMAETRRANECSQVSWKLWHTLNEERMQARAEATRTREAIRIREQRIAELKAALLGKDLLEAQASEDF